jgi:hypothetical protein
MLHIDRMLCIQEQTPSCVPLFMSYSQNTISLFPLNHRFTPYCITIIINNPLTHFHWSVKPKILNSKSVGNKFPYGVTSLLMHKSAT